ncbi:MAG: hypothetical protein ACU841_02040 [Gammaproteobacteria bacterium]
MKVNCKTRDIRAMEPANPEFAGPCYPQSCLDPSSPGMLEDDDRYPGTFFRIPGVPVPGRTGWRLAE